MGSAISNCFQEKQGNNFLKGKVMMKLQDAIRLKREGIIKLEHLAGHPNYITQLDEWAAVDRRATDQVYVFSYRHENGVFSDTQSLGKRYMSANYKWALDFMEQKYTEVKDKKSGTAPIAWLDILCTCHDNETLQDAFGYMGSLYLNNIVVNNYMKSPETFIQIQSRGWIYQESAFPAIELQEWDDDAWNDMTYYRVVADLILRRGYQAIIKKKALDLDSLAIQMESSIAKGKTAMKKNTVASNEWWEKVEKYKDMICQTDSFGIVLDLHGINESLNEAEARVDLGISSDTIIDLRNIIQESYEKIVSTLKMSLSNKATSTLLKYFAVSAIKAFLSSELSVESDRQDAIFGVLKAMDGWSDDLIEKKDSDILYCIWTLAYETGEILASVVRSKDQCLGGLKKVSVMEGESVTPHIPHLSKFVPPEIKEETKLYVGCLSKSDSDMEFCIELCVDSNDDVRAMRVIPKNYWNYNEVKAKLPIDKEIRDFME